MSSRWKQSEDVRVVPVLFVQLLLCVRGLPVLQQRHKLTGFKYLSGSVEPCDAGPVTGLSPPVVKRKNAALCFNRLSAARGKLMRLVNYRDVLWSLIQELLVFLPQQQQQQQQCEEDER